MRALALALLAGPAMAETPVGPPHWACHVAAACAADACIPLPGPFARHLVEATDRPDVLRMDGRNVGLYGSAEEALAAVAAGAIPSDAALVLVRDDGGLGDAIGFAAYAPSSRGGSVGLSETFASLICTGA